MDRIAHHASFFEPPAQARSSGAVSAAPCPPPRARGRTGTACCTASRPSCSSCRWCRERGLCRHTAGTPGPSRPGPRTPGPGTGAGTTRERACSSATASASSKKSQKCALSCWSQKVTQALREVYERKCESSRKTSISGRDFSLKVPLFRASYTSAFFSRSFAPLSRRARSGMWKGLIEGWPKRRKAIHSSAPPPPVRAKPIFRSAVVWRLKINVRVRKRGGLTGLGRLDGHHVELWGEVVYFGREPQTKWMCDLSLCFVECFRWQLISANRCVQKGKVNTY